MSNETHGLCRCGCGEPTTIANRSRKDRGWIKGQPVPYKRGHNPTVALFERLANFWSMVKLLPTSGWPDCLEWGAATQSNGYGGFFGERQAHRISYLLTVGPIPEGLDLDHLCRNRACINPYHLEPVTRIVNVRRGLKPKLTEELAAEIRSSSETDRAIALRLGVCHSTVNAVRAGRTWNA